MIDCTKFLRGCGRVLCAVGVLALAGGLGHAGEPIVFSGTGQKVGAEQRKTSQILLERRGTDISNTRSDALSAFEAMPSSSGASTPVLNKDDLERRDPNNSWIFNTAGSLKETKTPNELMGAQEYGPDGQLVKKPTAMEKYYRERDGQSQLGHLTTPWAQNQKDQKLAEKVNGNNPKNALDDSQNKEDNQDRDRTNRRHDGSLPRNAFGESNPTDRRSRDGQGYSSTRDQERLFRMERSLSQDFTDFTEGPKKELERKQREADFGKLLDGNITVLPTGRNDPANLFADPLGKEMNPVTPPTLEPIRTPRDNEPSFGGNFRSDSSFFDRVQSQMPSAAAPPPVRIDPLQKFQQRSAPTVLPFPQRQF